jgi:hypothetical protein
VWSGEEARGLFIGGLRRFGGEEDFSGGRSPVSSRGFSMSGRTSRRPVTGRLEQRRVNLCRDSASRGGAGLAACGGGDGGRPAGLGAGWCDNPPGKIPYYRLRPIHFGH